MIWTSFIAAVFLTSFTTGAAVDNEPPVITCPSDIVLKDLVVYEIRVNWDRPNATDNSGDPPSIISNRPSGDRFTVPGSYKIVYTAQDGSGNTATCSFWITLERKQCPLYPAPHFGALVCRKVGNERVCAVMCKSALDFTFDPPLIYYCSFGKWETFAFYPFSSSLPWPDCSVRSHSSPLKSQFSSYYFFSGDVSDPSVVEVIKGNFFNLLKSPFVPPLFCSDSQCIKESMEVFPGNVSDNEPPAITCPKNIVQNDIVVAETRVNWLTPIAKDNSGDPPFITSNRPPGDLFAVPGSYEIVYTAQDWSGNTATCSFRITLEKKTCHMYPPPYNGALACYVVGNSDPACAVLCKESFHFTTEPPLIYICSSGVWQFVGIGSGYTIPWPNCSAQAPPTGIESIFPYFSFSGDANDNSGIENIKDKFISLSQLLSLCQGGCQKDSVQVFAGQASS